MVENLQAGEAVVMTHTHSLKFQEVAFTAEYFFGILSQNYLHAFVRT